MINMIDFKVVSNFISTPALDFSPRPCTNRALVCSLHHDRAHSTTGRRKPSRSSCSMGISVNYDTGLNVIKRTFNKSDPGALQVSRDPVRETLTSNSVIKVVPHPEYS